MPSKFVLQSKVFHVAETINHYSKTKTMVDSNPNPKIDDTSDMCECEFIERWLFCSRTIEPTYSHLIEQNCIQMCFACTQEIGQFACINEFCLDSERMKLACIQYISLADVSGSFSFFQSVSLSVCIIHSQRSSTGIHIL